MPIISASGLRKNFGDLEAVRGISFGVEKGEIFGVLGPNGAGKSTTINMLATMLLPTSGTAKIDGLDVVREVVEVRKRIGLCTSASRFFWELTAKQILNYYAMLYGIDGPEKARKVEEMIDFFDIGEFQDRQFSQLSTGMKQKIALAKSLINDPVVWFLDEPTNGLDVEISRDVRRKIRKIVKEKGTTVVLTSHYLNEVEEMCDRIALLNEGRIITIGNISGIKASLNFFDTITFRLEKEHDADFLKRIRGIGTVKTDGKRVQIRAKSSQRAIGRIIEHLERKGIRMHELEIRRASLEDVFFRLVREAREKDKAGGRA